MAAKRKQHTAAFKAQVALAALKGDKTVNQLASQYGVHPILIHSWKKQLLAGADQVFSNGSKGAAADAEAVPAQLFEQIGRLKVELEWLKNNARLRGTGARAVDQFARPGAPLSGASPGRAAPGFPPGRPAPSVKLPPPIREGACCPPQPVAGCRPAGRRGARSKLEREGE
jgi:putative transposase